MQMRLDALDPTTSEATIGDVVIRCRDGSQARVDTSRGSALHHWIDFGGHVLPTSLVVYLWCVGLTYVPLLLFASWSVKPTGPTRLPFLLDWNIAFTFLVSFPTLVLLIVSDERGLALALKRVWASGVISTDVEDGEALARRWNVRFRWANVGAYAVGLSAGAVLSWLTLQAYVWTNAGFWAAPTGVPEAIGYVYLYCIALLYAAISVFVARSVLIALFLKELVERLTIRLLPFHPDGCGGLQPVGRLGLRNQYTLTILGLNIVIFGFVTLHYLVPRGAELYLMTIAVLVYAILGPVVFMGPLLPFRAGMLRSKAVLMGELSERLRTDFTAIRGKLQTEGLSNADVEALERLKKVGAMIEELPVWPFDARTLRTFGSAYVVPFVLPLLSKVVISWLGLKI